MFVDGLVERRLGGLGRLGPGAAEDPDYYEDWDEESAEVHKHVDYDAPLVDSGTVVVNFEVIDF